MKSALILAVLSLNAATAEAAQKQPCPVYQLGSYPWMSHEIMDGDLYAAVELKVLKDGDVQCLMGNNNLVDPDRRFFFCQTIAHNWKRGNAAPRSSTHDTIIVRGPKHIKADKQARKQFFIDHPDQRPDCYPEQ